MLIVLHGVLETLIDQHQDEREFEALIAMQAVVARYVKRYLEHEAEIYLPSLSSLKKLKADVEAELAITEALESQTLTSTEVH